MRKSSASARQNCADSYHFDSKEIFHVHLAARVRLKTGCTQSMN
jgi:hypothetical protein